MRKKRVFAQVLHARMRIIIIGSPGTWSLNRYRADTHRLDAGVVNVYNTGYLP